MDGAQVLQIGYFSPACWNKTASLFSKPNGGTWLAPVINASKSCNLLDTVCVASASREYTEVPMH